MSGSAPSNVIFRRFTEKPKRVSCLFQSKADCNEAEIICLNLFMMKHDTLQGCLEHDYLKHFQSL